MLKSLAALNKYLVKYKWRFLSGVFFVSISNVFAVLSPVVIRNVLDQVYNNINLFRLLTGSAAGDIFEHYIMRLVMISGLLLLLFAVLRGVFLFLMRQTIIVMSRHIEYGQKNEIFQHYQRLSTGFYKTHATGDLMSRISEDVSRVRMYTGPAIMYSINLIVLIFLCLWRMLSVSPMLTLYVLAPMPFLAWSVFYVNKIVNRKSEKIQAELSALTSQAQETYSGIRVIKSYAQEERAQEQYADLSEQYRKSSINLSLTESVSFPAMNLFIGLSLILTVLMGGWQAIEGRVSPGNIAEFVIYINMLMFPISAIGWTANMIQRAAVSQRRINEFLDTEPDIRDRADAAPHELQGSINLNQVSFTYPHTGIKALDQFSLHIEPGQRIAIIGKTGSGKSTLAHLLLHMYEADSGEILFDGKDIRAISLEALRSQISYVPQDVFLFSATIADNIGLGMKHMDREQIEQAARLADIDKEIRQLPKGYDTMTGERGVMLSGGQKQRIALARALVKRPGILILDESLSAVDTRTERTIQEALDVYLAGKTCIVITHRVFKSWHFDQLLVMDNGKIVEQGTHEELLALNGHYAALYHYQTGNKT